MKKIMTLLLSGAFLFSLCTVNAFASESGMEEPVRQTEESGSSWQEEYGSSWNIDLEEILNRRMERGPFSETWRNGSGETARNHWIDFLNRENLLDENGEFSTEAMDDFIQRWEERYSSIPYEMDSNKWDEMIQQLQSMESYDEFITFYEQYRTELLSEYGYTDQSGDFIYGMTDGGIEDETMETKIEEQKEDFFARHPELLPMKEQIEEKIKEILER